MHILIFSLFFVCFFSLHKKYADFFTFRYFVRVLKAMWIDSRCSFWFIHFCAVVIVHLHFCEMPKMLILGTFKRFNNNKTQILEKRMERLMNFFLHSSHLKQFSFDFQNVCQTKVDLIHEQRINCDLFDDANHIRNLVYRI